MSPAKSLMFENQPAADASPPAWAAWLLGRLETYESEASVDPMTNSVRRLAYDLSRLQADQTLSHDGLRTIAKFFSDEALLRRADDFADAHNMRAGNPSPETLVAEILKPLTGASFEDVRRALEKGRAGIVFTAHPTFAMSRALRAAFARRAEAKTAAEQADAAAIIAGEAQAPDDAISLFDEHEDASSAIVNAQAALRAVTREILCWAKERHPKDWMKLSPAPVSLATWVGYDLDGRTDIHWGQTFRIRLEEKAAQLNRYADQLKAVSIENAAAEQARFAEQLFGAAALAAEQAALFAGDLDDPAVVTRAANALTGDDPRRLISLERVLEGVEAMIASAESDDARLDLAILKSEMRAYGLGVGRIHLRINAAQVRSALRADLDLDADRAFIDRTAFDAAAAKAGSVARRRTNVASIFLEQMTARRQLMLCAEFLKHIDADTPIRFLIAESEAPATIMGAVYLARLYGVDRRLDISPLFETPTAIESGGRFLERLLSEHEFVNYIRARGRLAIQLGFSDSGRFMGQAAANLAIERLQILLARALAARKITDVDVVVFNTHGESMGRGGYPGSLDERFDYLITPWARARYRKEQIRVNAESSFQGGDGYLHFETPDLAAATVGALMRWSFWEPQADRDDSFYTDINYSWDLYRGIKTWQEALFDNEDYQAAAGAFAPNLLFTTGSRKARRQSGNVVSGPRSLRAIPHNAILQQLAAPANVWGGVGAAAGAEADRLVEMSESSPRLRQILRLVWSARARTSIPAVRAYAILFDAAFWIRKGLVAKTREKPFCEDLARHLSQGGTLIALSRFGNLLALDLARLDRIFKELPDVASEDERLRRRRSIHALHAIRQAMIMRGFLLVAELPAFSQRHDISRTALFDLAFALRFDELADLLDEIFPAKNPDIAALKGIIEPADDLESVHGYPGIQRGIIAPLRQIGRSIREIGLGLSHFYGAYG